MICRPGIGGFGAGPGEVAVRARGFACEDRCSGWGRCEGDDQELVSTWLPEAFETCDEVSSLLDGSHSAIKDEKQNYPNNDGCLGQGADAK